MRTSPAARGRRWVAPAVLTAGLLFATGCGQQGQQSAQPDQSVPADAVVELQAVSTPVPGAFTDSFGTDAADVASLATAQGTVPGDTAGLYATEGSNPPCDREALISRLNGDGGRASAWASARDIDAKDIPSHVRTLTPALLRADTALTDYRYENGRANPHPSVLQAGSAVLVDEQGSPATRCATGDPLGPPKHYDNAPRFSGQQWRDFRPAAIWVVEPARDSLPRFVLCDLRHRGDDRNAGYFVVERGDRWAPRLLPADQRPGPVRADRDRPWSSDQRTDQRDASDRDRQYPQGPDQHRSDQMDRNGGQRPPGQPDQNGGQPGQFGQRNGGQGQPDQHGGQGQLNDGQSGQLNGGQPGVTGQPGGSDHGGQRTQPGDSRAPELPDAPHGPQQGQQPPGH